MIKEAYRSTVWQSSIRHIKYFNCAQSFAGESCEMSLCRRSRPGEIPDIDAAPELKYALPFKHLVELDSYTWEERIR